MPLPVALVPKFTALVWAPAQTVWFEMVFSVIDGLTVILKFLLVPAHALLLYVYVGVTVIVPSMGAVVVLVPVNAAIELPVPLAARPMFALVFDQE